MPFLHTAYLVCATPRSGSTLLCEALKGPVSPGGPRSTSSRSPATRSRAARGLPRGPRRSRGARARRRRTAPEPPPYSSLAASAATPSTWSACGSGARRRTACSAPSSCGITSARLRRLRCGGSARPVRRPALVGSGAATRAAGGLAVAGDADAGVARRRRRGRRSGAARTPSAALHHLVGRLTDHDEQWASCSTVGPCSSSRYEDLTADLPGTVRLTLDHIGVAPPERDLRLPAMRRQADELSESWVAAYARDRDPVAR